MLAILNWNKTLKLQDFCTKTHTHHVSAVYKLVHHVVLLIQFDFISNMPKTHAGFALKH